ncbi:DNA-directed RNA polymerase subunit alpha [Candidatus Fermentibacteria bacterium]|nr:MAG: DNA-directed RNA polymerase subunit alpha [Candidatus Fermentibacteria bacterium]
MEYMKLHLPDIVKWDKETLTDRFGVMTITALERGFGRTLGNALRRVMLSSLEGAAPVSVTIKGAEHEFSVLSGVLEDVPDIILNVKSLAVTYQGEGVARLHLRGEKPGVYTAEAFQCEEGAVISNTDQVIAEITEDGGELDIVVNVERGKGFVTQDEWYNSGRGREIGDILVDSWFCPIKKVNFQVESARVGDRTDYDKLIMEITTDGSLSPQQALEHATGILMKHFELILGIRVEEETPAQEEAAVVEEEKTEEVIETPAEEPAGEDVTLADTDLSGRYVKILSAGGVNTLNDLAAKTADELLDLRNFGKASLEVVLKVLKAHGLSLAE